MNAISIDQIETMAWDGIDIADPEAERIRPNLEAIVQSLNEEGRLTPSGALAATYELAGSMRNRLNSLVWAANEPELTAAPVDNPLFLTGLPRSGTTFFQYLFDVDRSLRLMRTWETREPSPPPAVDPVSAARRLEDARRDIEGRNQTLEGWEAVHLSDPDGPDECHALLTQSFCQAGFFNYMNVPTYFDRLIDTLDHHVAFEVHKRQLQVLQWKCEPKRWALKYPNHVLVMPTILDVYPDARFVMTHRDPVQTLTSLCKLTQILRGERSDHVDPIEIGQQMRHFVRRHIDGIMSFAKTDAGRERVVHVDYYALTDAPAAVLADVYAKLGDEMPEDVRLGVADWHRKNPKGKRGKHEYSTAVYGLDADEIAEEYSDYIRHFDIPSEGVAARRETA